MIRLKHFLNSIVLSGITVIGTVAAMAADTGSIDGSTNVPISAAFAAASVAVGAAWWLGSRFTKIEDEIREVKQLVISRPCFKASDNCPVKLP